MSAPDQPLLALGSVSKRYLSTQALKDLSFELFAGEVHAIVGENGAGKSTALAVMYGVVQPTTGEIKVAGRTVQLPTPAAAQALGISCVFQELSLAGGLSIAENIYAGRAPTRLGFVDWRAMHRAARDLLGEFAVGVDVSRPVDRLPISTQQIVEIAKALSMNARILLLDEPTSALTPDEVETLFTILRKITGRGIGVVYVSHHMSEIFEIAGRITVLRDGRHVSTRRTGEISPSRVIAEMVGGELGTTTDRHTRKVGSTALQARGLTRRGQFTDVDLDLRAGQIIGLAGLMGSRRSEIARALVGLEQPDTGTLQVGGRDVAFRSLRDALQAGVGYIPNDRKTDGLFLEMSVRDNTVAVTLDRHRRFGLMSDASMADATAAAIDRLAIRTAGQETQAGELSGGNQQKLMLAKWFEISPSILVIDEPTKGVDVGAKQQIHAELRRRRDAGMAILLISSDWLELLSLADRIVVVRDGRIAAQVCSENVTEDDLLSLASGVGLHPDRLARIAASEVS